MHGFETHQLTRDDGVRLAVHDRPASRPDAPALFLANGLGGNLPAWRHLIRRFGPSHRIVSWDYRGLYGSRLAPEQKAGGVALDIEAHVADGLAVLDHLGLGRVVLVGWSMGVQLGFDLASRAPERVEALVALSGGYGRAFHHTAAGALGPTIAGPVMDTFRRAVDGFGGVLRQAGRSPLTMKAAKALGVVARTLDEEVFADLLDEYLRLDFEVYNRILFSLHDHDVEDALSGVRVPTLVVVGDRDPMTPHHVAMRMMELLPDAELMIIPGGTHYVPVEFPDLINRRLAGFLARRLGHAAGD